MCRSLFGWKYSSNDLHVLTRLIILLTVDSELVLVCSLVLCEHAPVSLVSVSCVSTYSPCCERSSMLVWTGTMCQITSLHAAPGTLSGTYKCIIEHNKHSSFIISWALRGLRGGCVAICDLSYSFSLFLWGILLWFPSFNVILGSRSFAVKIYTFSRYMWEKGMLFFWCQWVHIHTINKSH